MFQIGVGLGTTALVAAGLVNVWNPIGRAVLTYGVVTLIYDLSKE